MNIMGKSKKMKAPEKINPNEIKGRDYLMVDLINGMTKSGAHVNRKKRADKYKARRKVRANDED